MTTNTIENIDTSLVNATSVADSARRALSGAAENALHRLRAATTGTKSIMAELEHRFNSAAKGADGVVRDHPYRVLVATVVLTGIAAIIWARR